MKPLFLLLLVVGCRQAIAQKFTVEKQDSTSVKVNWWPYADVWNTKSVFVGASLDLDARDVKDVFLGRCINVKVFPDPWIGTTITISRKDSAKVKIIYH